MIMELLKKDIEGKSEEELHPGCVKRILSFRDRLLILAAIAQPLEKGGDLKAQARLLKARELLDGEGADDYFTASDDAFNKLTLEWAKAKKTFLEKAAGSEDPGKQPKRSEADETGEAATFWIPSKLDSHIQEILKTALFQAHHAKYVVSLAKKFGVAIED